MRGRLFAGRLFAGALWGADSAAPPVTRREVVRLDSPISIVVSLESQI